eukprot:1257417-Prorocentrum_lima.AAC.1
MSNTPRAKWVSCPSMPRRRSLRRQERAAGMCLTSTKMSRHSTRACRRIAGAAIGLPGIACAC